MVFGGFWMALVGFCGWFTLKGVTLFFCLLKGLGKELFVF